MNPEASIETSIDRISDRLTEVELMAMTLAGKRLAEIWDKDLSNYFYLDDANNDLRKIHKALNKAHKENIAQMNSLFKGVTAEVYSTGQEMAERKDARLSPLSGYRQEASPLLRQAVKNYEIAAKSTTLNETYKKTIRKYVSRLTTGDEEYAPVAIRKATRELLDQGISTINHKSGRIERMDTAVRRDLLQEYTQIVNDVQEKLGEELDASAIEVSFHRNSAPDHEDIQGRVFLLSEFEKLQSGQEARDVIVEKYDPEKPEEEWLGEYYQTDRPITFWNCHHMIFSFLLGISERSTSLEDLENAKKENKDGIDWNGERISLYDGIQEQRRIETALRREKEAKAILYELRGIENAEHYYQQTRQNIKALNAEYERLGEILRPYAIRMKPERASIPRP